MITADCELWLDGVRVPDTAAALITGAPTALSALVLQWGRQDSVSQPDTATCRFALRDNFGAESALDNCQVGMLVRVYASGALPANSAALYPDPGFSHDSLGPLDATRYQATSPSLAPTVITVTGGPQALKLTSGTANLLTAGANGTFEGGVTTGWGGTGVAPTLAADNTRAKGGSYSLRVGWGAGATAGPGSAITATVAGLTIGTSYTLQGWLYIPAGSIDACVYARGATNFLGNDVTQRDAWVRSSVTFQATAASMSMRVGNRQVSVGGELCFVDSLTLTQADAIWVPPLPFDPATITAWDSLPRISPGQTWHVSVTANIPTGCTAVISARTYTAPNPGAAEAAGIVTVSAPAFPVGLSTVTGSITLPAARPAPVWVALGIAVTGGPPAVPWSAAVGAWSAHPEAWNASEQPQLYQLQAEIAGTPIRRVLVFAGSVTDVTASPADDDINAIMLDVTAADITADLGSDVIGAEPWLMETLGTRIQRIVGASKLHTPVTIDASLQPTLVSWRDVDAQPVLALLQDLAQTCGGVLWPSFHATTGGYLWIEDTYMRVALRELVMQGGTITVAGGSGRDIDQISACDVLRDPVQLSQTISEITTTVSVQWKEQTLDEDGLPAPTDRTVTQTDEAAFSRYGLRGLQVATELTSPDDANFYAGRLLDKSRAVTWKASGYQLDTAYMQADISGTTHDQRMTALMDLLDGTTRIGQAISLVDMPPWLPAPAGLAYVEGGSYSYRDGWWVLELTISPGGQSGQSAQWQQLDNSWQWNQWDPGLSWADITGVGA